MFEVTGRMLSAGADGMSERPCEAPPPLGSRVLRRLVNWRLTPACGTRRYNTKPSGPAAQRPSGPAAQRPSGPAAQRPSGPAAQRPSGPAAQRPSGPAAQRPSGPAAQRPSGPAAQRPSGPAAQRPSGPAAQRHDVRPAPGRGAHARLPSTSVGSPRRPDARTGRARARRFARPPSRPGAAGRRRSRCSRPRPPRRRTTVRSGTLTVWHGK